MSEPLKIKKDSARRLSIAKLTKSPISGSPVVASPSSRAQLLSQSFKANGPFSRRAGVDSDSIGPTVYSSLSMDDAIDDSEDSKTPPNDGQENGDYSQGIHDPTLIKKVVKHLPDNENLKVEGGDMVRDLYKLGQDIKAPKITRSLSSSELNSRRGSTASSLNVPGGFRREFITQKLNKRLHQTVHPNFLTKNFVEFLSIYGHFAGEELENEDDIICHYKPIAPNKYLDEESGLLNDETVNTHGTATERKAYFLLLKAFVGTGVLFLPKAFSNGGLLFSIILLAFFGLLSFWCYLILVYTKVATGVSSFAEIGNKLFGPWFQNLILFSIVISQVGFVAAYMVFTSENLRAFIVNSTSWESKDINLGWLIVAQAFILIPLSFIRDITKLSLLAVLANFFILGGLITIVYYILVEYLFTSKGQFGPGIEFLFNQSEFSLFIGVAIFAFEGIGLIIPIQESMIYPDRFPKVLAQVIVTISLVMIAMGTIGYLTFGENIQTVILLNLPQDSPMVSLTQLLYSFAILLSTPLQLFPAIRLMESNLFFRKTGKNSPKVKWAKNLFRTISVLLICVIAYYGGQNLDKFVSLVGCFACIPLVYVYPPILHIKSCCQSDGSLSMNERKKRFWLANVDYLLVVIGMVAMVYTTSQILFG